MLSRVFAGLCVAGLLAGGAWGDDGAEEKAAESAEAESTIRALYITGGGWHDYAAQQTIVTDGLAERLAIEWEIDDSAGGRSDVVIERFKEDDWAAGYDVVVYNICQPKMSDRAIVESIADMHRETGTAAVFLHGAVHSFRAPTDKWFRFSGITSHEYEGHRPVHVKAIEPSHPVMRGFPGEGWSLPEGELYEIDHVWETATPLAHSLDEKGERHHVNVWVNRHGKARVFGTTIGHHNATMADPVYLDLVSRGVLWTLGRLEQEKTTAAAAPAAEAAAPAADSAGQRSE